MFLKITPYLLKVDCRRLCLWALMAGAGVANANADALMHAQIYTSGSDVSAYLVSEKLDGVRARWDGKQFISRQGNVFTAPAWFSAQFPEVVLDGELWSTRDDFANIVSIVRSKNAAERWRQLRFWVFDLPELAQPFAARVAQMRQLLAATPSPYLAMIEQRSIASDAALMQLFDTVIDGGGEGLMLHRKGAFYQPGKRSHDLLKLKSYQDADATVLGYKPGNGRLEGMVGSLQVRNQDGIEFYIGSGLNDAERRDPPPIGSTISYRYQSFTHNGVPRFPVFLRRRPVE